LARMIPPEIAPDCDSPGERLLFPRFRDDPATADWIVLHSQDIARHPKRLEGEADFVVLIPGEGVLVLEVKAGNVARHAGVWKYGLGATAQSSPTGPFRQAADAMHAIRTDIARQDSSLGPLLFYSGVFFTYIDFDEQSPEWHSWQIANRTDLRSPIPSVCIRMIRRAHEHVQRTASAAWYNVRTSRPTRDQLARIAEILRPNFEYVISPQERVTNSEQRILRFTQEQFRALDAVAENHRVVFKGPAGTGKTFLAMETAERALRSGSRVLLACYNRLLGDWLAHRMQRAVDLSHGRLTVDTFHGELLRLSGVPIEASAQFWERRLPDCVVQRGLEGGIKAPLFDLVVLDEAQDLLRDPYLDALELLLAGGLAGGRWALFGDFERQAIYAEASENADGLTAKVRARAPQFAVYSLRTNCRNSENIAVGLELACRLDPGYSGILNAEAGPDLVVRFYRDGRDQALLLKQAMMDAGRRFLSSQLRVLSMKEDSSSCAAHLAREETSVALEPLRRGSDGPAIRFSTIHAFKGLEAPAIILTDIEEFGGERMESLLYVGMSRARLHLCILMHERCRAAYEQALRRGLHTRKARGHGYS
jgi:hypothetical protein